MNEHIEANINELGRKIDIVESLSKALTTSLCGCEELTQKDAYNLIFVLNDKLQELKNLHNKIIDKLEI